MSIKEARAWRDNNNELLSQGITPPKKYEQLNQVLTDQVTFKEMFDMWHQDYVKAMVRRVIQLIPNKEEICIYSLNLVSYL